MTEKLRANKAESTHPQNTCKAQINRIPYRESTTSFDLKPVRCLQYMSHLMTKPTKCSVRPAKTQIHLVWSVFTVHSLGSQGPNASLCGQRRIWSDWACDQTWSESSLGAQVILLVLSCCVKITLSSGECIDVLSPFFFKCTEYINYIYIYIYIYIYCRCQNGCCLAQRSPLYCLKMPRIAGKYTIKPGIFLTILGTGPVPVPLGKIATYCSKLGIFTVWWGAYFDMYLLI